MATGYTWHVESGEVATLREFALICSAAFLVRMRDGDSRTPPEKFEPTTYIRDRLKAEEAELERLLAMDEDEIREAAAAYNRSELEHWEDHQAHVAETKARHQAMLEKVEAWEPPTPAHAELKNFMRSQLQISMRPLDTAPRPQEVEPRHWHTRELDSTRRSIERWREDWEKEQKRTEAANQWLSELRDSFEPEEEAAHV